MNEKFFSDITYADLATQLGSVQEKVQATLRRVRLGLAAVQVPDADERLSFPELAFELTMAMWEPSPNDDEISDFRSWILQNGFRNLIEQTHLHLDWAGSFCKALQIRKRMGLSGLQSNASAASEEIDSYWDKLHRMYLRRKMGHLREEYNIDTNLDDAITSAQKARNCLAHRDGWVSEEFDCDESSALKMVWIAPEIERRSGKGRGNLLKKPSDIRGGVYLIGHSPGRRAFAAGHRIDFTAREFNDIAITCYFYCREVTLAAVRYGRETLRLPESVPELDDEWLNQTAVHLYLNDSDKLRRSQALVVNWKGNRLKVVGIRSMVGENQEPERA